MSKKRLDIMTDIETLGTDADSTIIQISAIAFDIKSGDYKYDFDECANISKNKNMKVTGSTIQWWLKTNPSLLLDITKRQDQTSEKVVLKFYDWLVDLKRDYDLYLWGNGILFDNNIIRMQIELLDLKYPIFYRNDRDLRTLVDLTSEKLKISEQELKNRVSRDDLVAHDGFDDCKYQIDLASYCYNILSDNKEVM